MLILIRTNNPQLDRQILAHNGALLLHINIEIEIIISVLLSGLNFILHKNWAFWMKNDFPSSIFFLIKKTVHVPVFKSLKMVQKKCINNFIDKSSKYKLSVFSMDDNAIYLDLVSLLKCLIVKCCSLVFIYSKRTNLSFVAL